jgi:uncharacterized protein (DUF2336 family)
MQSAGTLDETAIDTALASGDTAFVIAALAVLSGLPPRVVRKVVDTQSAKGIVAVGWKADLSPSLAAHLQVKMLHLPGSKVLNPAPGGNHALSMDEMEWQLEFFGAQ